MKRIYLNGDGFVMVPTEAERSHYGMAKTVLGPNWVGDAEDAYAEMWKRGWIRVVENPDTVFAEKYIDGRCVPLTELTKAQIRWLEDKKLEGKKLVWNGAGFVESREKAAAIVAKAEKVLTSVK